MKENAEKRRRSQETFTRWAQDKKNKEDKKLQETQFKFKEDFNKKVMEEYEK